MKKIIRKFKSPAYSLVFETARKNWWLVAVNLVSNFLSAVLEGSTVGVIYLAISYLSVIDNPAADTVNKSPITHFLSSTASLTSQQTFLLLIGVALLLQIMLSCSSYANKVSAASLSAKAQPYATGKVFKQMMTFSYGYISRYKVGDLVLFANDSALAVDREITEFNSIVVGVSFSIVYLLVIVRLSLLLAVAAAFLTLIVALVQYRLVPRLRHIAKGVTSARVESAKCITENIQALRLLHTFGTQSRAVSTANQKLDELRRQLQKRALVFYMPEPILETLPVLALAVLATSAILLKSESANIMPMLLTFLLALQRLSVRLKSVAGTITRFTDNSASMMRLGSILDESDKMFEKQCAQIVSEIKDDIEFSSVSLSYANDNVYSIEDLTFKIEKNKVTALVGESGAGKSSIVDLLMGLYLPTSGQILINGQPLSDYSLLDWRQKVGVVSQDTFVFNDSILENLRYGRVDATLDEVIEGTKIAQAHEFIMALPEGYETIVGERGYRLSGGQRQRLALARAIIKQPEVLILDEATSALDSESEQLIQQALAEFQYDRTVIVIAHRLSTIAEADRIIVLEHGQIIEQGTHEALIAKGDRYARYWKLQGGKVFATNSV